MTLTSASAAATAVTFTNTCSNPYSKIRRPKTPLEFVLGAIPLRNPIPTSSSISCCRSSNRLISLSVVARAAGDDKEKYQNQENDDNNDIINGVEEEERSSQQQASTAAMIKLDDVNPVGLGRRSRQIFDELWRKFSGLGQISRTTRTDDETSLLIKRAVPCALVRKADEQVVDMLPTSVEIVIGDVGDPSSLKAAVKGCNKIIYCATARSSITGDLNRVDYQGVSNLTKAFQDYNNKLAQLRAGKSSKSKLLLAKFKSADSLNGWDVRQGTYFQDAVPAKYDGGMDAKFEIAESGDAVFSGYVFTRGGYVELSKKLSLPLGRSLDRHVRIPFSSFRPVKADDPPLDPFLVHTLTIRFEPRRQRPIEGPAGMKQDMRSFQLIMEYIKALPGGGEEGKVGGDGEGEELTGEETDFILVSCTGLGIEPTRREQVLKAKKAGEDSLRRSGLGYTIIRPGPLQEEPGGQRALIFDQGNRISQGISCADVADICVKALHDSTARNRSFDVCYEYVAEPGKELYELVELVVLIEVVVVEDAVGVVVVMEVLLVLEGI
ncbi:hypothetical protein C3L33_00003, partial [Rhododendron williamsianum]